MGAKKCQINNRNSVASSPRNKVCDDGSQRASATTNHLRQSKRATSWTVLIVIEDVALLRNPAVLSQKSSHIQQNSLLSSLSFHLVEAHYQSVRDGVCFVPALIENKTARNGDALVTGLQQYGVSNEGTSLISVTERFQ
jgi:hypothetical protein